MSFLKIAPDSSLANGENTQIVELWRHNQSDRITNEAVESSDNRSLSQQQHVIEVNNEGSATPRAYPFVLSFNNLSYSVKAHQKRPLVPVCGNCEICPQVHDTKVLLNDISGEAREGEIMAVLGASGAGKSTFIDALAGRIERSSLKGTVKLNGEVVESNVLKVISAYVMQDDLLFPMLTVEETLMFSAECRIPRTVSKAKKQARVEALIDQLGLRRAAKTVIGDEGHRGVSGGERRRVSIGIDIIHDPILLFLDEPTSGLDSTSAFIVIKVLQGIAKSGSMVMMSLHQPSYRILGLLDRLIFFSRGQTIYDGTPADISPFFEEFGRPIPENANQTEFALDLIRELEEIPSGITSLVEFNKSWQSTNNQKKVSEIPNLSLTDAIKASISKGKLVSAGSLSNDSNLTSLPTFSNPFWTEIRILAKRTITNSRRMPELFGIRLATVLASGAILASLYWHLSDSPRGTDQRLAFISFGLITIFFTCAVETPAFIQERFIFIRETAYHAYRSSSYVLAHSIVTIPSLITLALVFGITTFWAVGLSGGFSGFIDYTIILLAAFWAGSSFAVFISGLISNLTVSFTVVVSLLAYFLLFSGFYINRQDIPSYWMWFHYLSIVKYPYEALLQNEYSSDTTCFMKGVQLFDETPFVDEPLSTKLELLESISSTLGTNITSSTCLTTGMKILDQKGVTDISKWNCFWITVAWGVLFRFLFYMVLSFATKNKRK